MDGTERLYYALGKVCYAVAKADGVINYEERNKLHDIVVNATKHNNYNFNISEIIFHILQKDDGMDLESTYNMAIKEFKTCSNYLTEDMKADFSAVLEKVARAFDSVTFGERNIIERFRMDIDEL